MSEKSVPVERWLPSSDVDVADDGRIFTAGIDDSSNWGHRIQVHAHSEDSAIELRDIVLKALLAEPAATPGAQGVPVAWRVEWTSRPSIILPMIEFTDREPTASVKRDAKSVTPLYASPQPQAPAQESAAWDAANAKTTARLDDYGAAAKEGTPLTDALQTAMCKEWDETGFPDDEPGTASYFTNGQVEKALQHARTLESKLAAVQRELAECKTLPFYKGLTERAEQAEQRLREEIAAHLDCASKLQDSVNQCMRFKAELTRREAVDAELVQRLETDDIVFAERDSVLHSGCGMYSHAIVVSANPLVLVSEETDMLWSATTKDMKLRAVGKADFSIFKNCMSRYLRDKEHEAAAALAGRKEGK